MEQRPKLELEINQPTHIKLLFDEPIVGESKFGSYFLYACTNGNGKEYSFFAPDAVHEVLKNQKKGTEAIITKLASQRGKKLVTTYDVQIVGDIDNSNGKDNAMPSPNQPTKETFYFDAMEKSLEEAAILVQKYNNLSLATVAISMFISRTKSNGFTHE